MESKQPYETPSIEPQQQLSAVTESVAPVISGVAVV